MVNLLIVTLSPLLGVYLGALMARGGHVFQRVYENKCNLIISLHKEIVGLSNLIEEYAYFLGSNTNKNSLSKREKELDRIKKVHQSFRYEFLR